MKRIDDPYIAGFLKAAESNNVSAVFLVKLARKLGDKMSKSNLEKRAGRFAQYVGNKVGRLTSLLFGGSLLRSQNLRAIKDLNKQLAPLKNELGGLKTQVRGLTPEMLNTYNSRIAELNNLIAEAYRTRNPAMSMKQFQKSLNPYINELSELQKRTRGLTESTLLGNNARIGDLRRQIGDLNRQKTDLYDPIRSENKKVLLARTGALGVGTLGAGMYFNSKNAEDFCVNPLWLIKQSSEKKANVNEFMKTAVGLTLDGRKSISIDGYGKRRLSPTPRRLSPVSVVAQHPVIKRSPAQQRRVQQVQLPQNQAVDAAYQAVYSKLMAKGTYDQATVAERARRLAPIVARNFHFDPTAQNGKGGWAYMQGKNTPGNIANVKRQARNAWNIQQPTPNLMGSPVQMSTLPQYRSNVVIPQLGQPGYLYSQQHGGVKPVIRL